MIPSLYLGVSLINQNLIMKVEVFYFFNIKRALFRVDMFENIIDVVVHYSHSVETFFCGRVKEFVVVIKLYSV